MRRVAVCHARQLQLIQGADVPAALPAAYTPEAARGFQVQRIVLARGSLATAEREAFVRRICAAYPHVPVEERLDLPHNRVELGEPDSVRRIMQGKRTLVFGEIALKSAVYENRHQGGMYPHERFFSVYGYCAYSCAYCYLNATPLAAFSPAVRVYVNLPEIAADIARQSMQAARPIGFYLGKMQDGLALDPLTHYSPALGAFFARHPYARQIIQTKAADVRALLNAEHGGHTAIAWTLTPEPIARRYEPTAPPTEERLAAMARCAQAGYPVGANLAPLILEDNWEDLYFDLIRTLLDRVAVRRIYLGGMYLKRLSRRFFNEQTSSWRGAADGQNGDWCRTHGGRVLSYRQGYGRAFFRRIHEYVQRRYRCRFEYGDVNGGSLVVRFSHGQGYRLFPDCPEGGYDSAAT
ncbi:MAG: hypothetical protein JXR94_05695 [Candidatus Hydrogenedentes bacterium]|nr:hypothetical protein [Candidatus Hydrogenedentota bacterium]